MKKLLTALALLLPLAAMAQTQVTPHWQAVSSNIYGDETVVNVRLIVNGEPYTINTPVELAAFIGDGDEETCRAYCDEARPISADGGASPDGDYFVLRVRGNKTADDTYPSDMDKTIKFRAFHHGIEYEFTKTVSFTGETYTPSPLVLYLDAVTGVSMPATIEVNEPASAFGYNLTRDLKDYIAFEYGSSTEQMGESIIKTPYTYSWNAYNYSGALSFYDDELRILKAEDASYNVNPSVTFDPESDEPTEMWTRTTIKVTVAAVPVTSITCDITNTDVYAFEDFATFIDAHITILPEEASIKTYQITGAENVLVNGEFQAGGQYVVNIVPDDAQFEGLPPKVNVTVYVRPSNIAYNNRVINVNYGDDVYAAIAANQTLTWPTEADPGDYGKREVTYVFGEEGYVDAAGLATKIGSVSVTVTLVNGITPVPTFQGQASYTVTVNILSQLDITAQLTNNLSYVKNGTQVSENSPAYVYVNNPGNEPFDPADLMITFGNRYETETGDVFPYAIQSSVVKEGVDETNGDTYGFRIQPLFIGYPSFSVTYQGQELVNGVITISKEEALSAGWTWLSMVGSGGSLDGLLTQADIVEVRSQEQLLWNDPTYGYVGNLLNLLPEEGMYKIKTNKATKVDEGSFAAISPVAAQTKTIYPRYTWVNYPYEFDLTADRFAELLGADFKPAYGDRIITQTGFAEFDEVTGAWAADATFALKEGQGFMYYSKDVEEKRMTFSPSLLPTVPNAAGGVKRFAPRTVAADDILEYDVHAFADNMSMVAEIQGLENPEDYTLGAFVDDECRGRGRVAVDGKMFVSAVGTSGEYVSFKLVNNSTGQVLPIDGVVSFSQIQGSLRAPVKLNMPIATGINKTNGTMQSTEAYDLSGRRITGNQRGVSIERMADGSVRKVVKK